MAMSTCYTRGCAVTGLAMITIVLLLAAFAAGAYVGFMLGRAAEADEHLDRRARSSRHVFGRPAERKEPAPKPDLERADG